MIDGAPNPLAAAVLGVLVDNMEPIGWIGADRPVDDLYGCVACTTATLRDAVNDAADDQLETGDIVVQLMVLCQLGDVSIHAGEPAGDGALVLVVHTTPGRYREPDY